MIRVLDVAGVVDGFIAFYFNAFLEMINHPAQNDLTVKTIEYSNTDIQTENILTPLEFTRTIYLQKIYNKEKRDNNMYQQLAIAAYIVVLFLTLRDIRIFRRTRLVSYRKGALRGLVASTIVLLGTFFVGVKPDLGLLIVLIGLYINRKGIREDVFEDTAAMDRLLGKTDYHGSNEVKK